jgi:hypothetical protein
MTFGSNPDSSSIDKDIAGSLARCVSHRIASDLPNDLLSADAALHGLLEAVSFSPHLNPVNIDEARQAFFAGAHAPPFAYAPATWADDALRRIDAIRPPLDHPLGVEVDCALGELRALVLALRDRTAEAFDHLNRVSDYYPDDEDLLPLRADEAMGGDPPTLDADRMMDVLRAALDVRGLDEWTIVRDPVMAARVLVDGAKHLIRLNPAARFREIDMRTLVAHEIDVHATRARNGRGQALHLFQDGLSGSLLTEEGLALAAEAKLGAIQEGFLARQQLFVDAVELSRVAGFREVYDMVSARGSPALGWGVTLRVKRGLAQPGEPGVYAKDTVYARGYRRIWAWLEAGGDISRLYVGKVAMHHPVEAWIEAGWVTKKPVPDLWLNPPG